MSRWDWKISSWYFTYGSWESCSSSRSRRSSRTWKPWWSDGPRRTSGKKDSEKVKSRVQGPVHSKWFKGTFYWFYSLSVIMWSLKEVGMLIMMCWHLVAGVMVVQQEWVVVCPPHYLWNPLVNCWLLAGMSLLTAWSGTRAAGLRHSCMSEVISVQTLPNFMGEKKATKDVSEEFSLPLIQWHLFCCSCQWNWCSSYTLYERKTDKDEFSFIPTASIHPALSPSLVSFQSVTASSLLSLFPFSSYQHQQFLSITHYRSGHNT